jgi:hypothetical protein
MVNTPSTTSSAGRLHPVELVDLPVDQCQDDQAGASRQQRLEELEEEIQPVLHLVHRDHSKVQRDEPQRVH